jgi:tetratricopeptide (TPR) repeat protein
MFSVMVELIDFFFKKTMEETITHVSSSVRKSRDRAAFLMQLYSSLLDLEDESQKLLDVLEKFANSEEPVSPIAKVPLGRIQIAKGFQPFEDALAKFKTLLARNREILSLYERETYEHLLSIEKTKGRYQVAIDYLQVAAPILIDRIEDATCDLIYATNLPVKTDLVRRIVGAFSPENEMPKLKDDSSLERERLDASIKSALNES